MVKMYNRKLLISVWHEAVFEWWCAEASIKTGSVWNNRAQIEHANYTKERVRNLCILYWALRLLEWV